MPEVLAQNSGKYGVKYACLREKLMQSRDTVWMDPIENENTYMADIHGARALGSFLWLSLYVGRIQTSLRAKGGSYHEQPRNFTPPVGS